MPLIARDIISAARDRHAAFDLRQTPDASALRFLSQYTRELHGKIAAVDRDVLRTEVEVTVPDPFADGIELPASRQVIEVAASTAARSDFPIALIAAVTRNDLNAPWPAAWQVGDRLYLAGDATAWRTVTGLAIAYIPMPVALARPSDELAVPDAAEHAVTANLALFMAMRGTTRADVPAINTGDFGAQAGRAEQTYLDDVVLGLSGRTFTTRDVWRP